MGMRTLSKKTGLLFLGQLLVFLLGGFPAQAETPEEVMVVVLAHPRGDRVSCSFPKVLSSKEVKDYLHRLTQIGGWKAERVAVNTVRLPTGPMTSFEFTSPFVVIPSTGTFDLNPFLQAFKALKHIGIVYLVPPFFKYKGVRQFEDDHLKLWLESHPGVYQFHITIKDPQFEDFRLPLESTPSSDNSPPPSHSVGGGGLGIFFLFFGLGLILASLTYWLTMRVHRREASETRG